MEQKHEGTPNPLNPSPETEALDANPSEPMQPMGESEPAAEPIRISKPANFGKPVDPMIPVRPSQPMQPVQPSQPAQPEQPSQPVMAGPVAEPEPVAETGQPVQPMGVVTNTDGTMPAQPMMDPMERPMQRAVEELPPKPKKKKTGLIIAAVISLFIAIGCGVAAALILLNNNKEDVVATAFGRLISGGAPTNLAVDGTVNVEFNDASSAISDMQINLKAEGVAKSMINTASAKLNANLRDGKSFSVDLGEVYAANGDLYLRVDGVTNMMDSSYSAGEVVTEEGTNSAEALAGTLKLLEMIDGEWIRLSTDDLGTVAPATGSSTTVCLTNLVNDLAANSNIILGIYNKNPFIASTTDKLQVLSEKNPIYKVLVDNEKLTGFLNEASGTAPMQNLAACTGSENAEVSASAVEKTLREMPAVYVEIDENYNFTRLYVEYDNGDMKVVADLDFTFPNNVNVPEPTEYKNLSTMLQELMTSMINTGEVEAIEVTPAG